MRGKENEFSDGDFQDTDDLWLMNNLYWNGDEEIPNGDLISPLLQDGKRIIQDPMLEMNHEDIVLPVWDGEEFISGQSTIREEFVRLVNQYGRIALSSPAVDMSDPSFAPKVDILDHARSGTADIGAYEYFELNNLPKNPVIYKIIFYEWKNFRGEIEY